MKRDGSSKAARLERQAGDAVGDAVGQAKPWIERVARVGYAAYGTVYVLIGVLASRTAFGGGGRVTSQEGAMSSVLSAPFGVFLLGAITLGLFCYAAWCLLQGITDPDNEFDGAKGVVKRADRIGNSLFHAALAFSAAQLAFGSGGGGGGSPDDWTATLMSQPFGRWLVGAVGAGFVLAGLYQYRKVYDLGFMDYLKPAEMSHAERRTSRWAGRFGYAARGIVFAVIGVFLVQGARQFDPQEARGLGGALQTLARQPFGPYLLGAVAVGLVAYGIFMFVVARYRRINTG